MLCMMHRMLVHCTIFFHAESSTRDCFSLNEDRNIGKILERACFGAHLAGVDCFP
jgi:hypothetical protein